MEERRREVRGIFLQQFIGKFQDERELSVLQNHQALIQIFSILVPIGLEYITEYTNPRKVSDHPMYTCSLEGCKSAWGTSDDIFNHCIKPKHHKNFFKKLNPDDTRIAGLSSADVGLTLARRIIR